MFDNAKLKRDTGYIDRWISWRDGVRRNVAWLERKNPISAEPEDHYEDRLIEAWQARKAELPLLA